MDDRISKQLENDIYNKLVAYEYSDAGDETLSGFIITLLKVGKNAQQVNEELLLLVGTDYDSNLTEWIFTRKQELEALASAPETSTSMQVEQPQQPQQPSEEQSTLSIRQTERMDTEKPKSRVFSQALGGVLANDSKKRIDVSSPRRRSDRSRSRSRSPGRRSTRYERPERTSRHEHQDTRKSTDVLSRLGNVKDSSGDKPSVFDRLGGSKPIDIPERHQRYKEDRCKYWPNCQKGDDCTYVHPTSICPDFPNCPKNASECLGIHPEISQPVLQPNTAKIPYPCKFFPYCNNPVCPFMHPTMPPQQAYFMQAQPSFPKVGQRVQIPCKNGDACTRPDCHFLHPKDAAYASKSEVVCKFDGACTRPNCFYKHTKENNTQNKVFINKSENTNARQFSVPEDQIEERITVGESADVIRESEQPSASRDVNMES